MNEISELRVEFHQKTQLRDYLYTVGRNDRLLVYFGSYGAQEKNFSTKIAGNQMKHPMLLFLRCVD